MLVNSDNLFYVHFDDDINTLNTIFESSSKFQTTLVSNATYDDQTVFITDVSSISNFKN